MKNITSVLLSLCFALSGFCSEITIPSNSVVYQGFGKLVSGDSIDFHSHVPYTKNALIVRTNNTGKCIEWETEVLPKAINSKQVSFAWIAGVSGTMHGKQVSPMTLHINGKEMVTFNTAGEKSWEIKGNSNSRLSFREYKRDGSDDRFGLMVFTLPASMVKTGQPVKFKVTTSNKGRDSWTMVFKSAIQYDSTIKASCMPVKLANSGKQVVKISYFHFGSPQKATITYDNIKLQRDITFGQNQIELPIDPVSAKRKVEVTLNTNNNKQSIEVELAPMRNWEANFVQITHTDIGYTRPQTDILAEHVRFIDYVLDYCDATDNYPDDAKFRWTCEGSWAVSEFLNSRPQSQIDRFVKRVKEGRIELTAMYFNFDEMPDEQTLAASLAPLKEFKKYGITPAVATQNDVNGIGWCFNEFFPEIGVKYLTMGVNLHKAVAPFDMPTYFYWTSPSGKKVLAYYGEHYMHGNALGVNGTDFEAFENKFLNYLNDLNSKNFRYDILGIEFLGVGGDNSAPSPSASEIVKQWNDKYDWPKIRLSLFNDYLGKFEARYGTQIESIRGAWPDWWTDGFASGAREAAATRRAHSELIAAQNGFAMSRILGSELPKHLSAQAAEVNKSILFYDEHTFGFDASIWLPFCRETMEQRSVKASYAWESFRRSRMLSEASLGFLNQFVQKSERPSIAIFNPLSWSRTGLVETYVDFTIFPLDKSFRVVDADGKPIKVQINRSRHDGAYWYLWVENVPALGYKQYFVELVDGNESTPELNNLVNSNAISNQWFDIKFNKKRGSIESIYDKELQKELLSKDAKWQFGEMIHEQLESRTLDKHDIGKHTRTTPKNLKFVAHNRGAIWDSYRFAGQSEAGIGDKDNMYVEYLVFHHTKRIDVKCGLTKKLETNPEAIYVSFPFEIEGGKSYFDIPGQLIEAATEQIRGTSNDWNNVQTHAALKSNSQQIVIGSAEVPMWQFGAINTGRFKKMAEPESGNMYSYVMNNYWTTNFNADQHGEFEWRYFITSVAGASSEFSTRFAWENRVPCLARAIPAGSKGAKGTPEASALSISPSNLALVTMTPVDGENAVLLHLREVGGHKCEAQVSSPLRKLTVQPANVLGEVNTKGTLTVNPWETKFIKISW